MLMITKLSDVCQYLAFQKYKGTNNKHNFQNWIRYRPQLKGVEPSYSQFQDNLSQFN